MESVSSRKRPCDGEEAHWKRRCREEEEVVEMKSRRKNRTAGGEENREPQEHLRRNHGGTENLKREPRRISQSRSKTRTLPTVRTEPGSGFRSGDSVWSYRPEVRVALIRKTRMQTTAELRGSKVVQIDPGSGEQQDKRRPARARSRSRAGPLRPAGLVSEIRTSRRSDRVLNPESRFRTRTRSEGRKRKIHPSAFRGRGQLRLSITPEAGQLLIHIHEAQGLMGKSPRPCDSYVKLAVTSDLDRSVTLMKTETVLNNKNPKYNQRYTLCVSDDFILNRLLVSVFSRCRLLIGCMSFGIGSLFLSSKLVTGWFFLLGEEFGRSKHLRVTSQPSRPMRSREKGGAKEEDEPTVCDLRRTPDLTPEADLKDINTASTATNLPNNNTITAGLRDWTNHTLTSGCLQSLGPPNTNYSSYVSTLSADTVQRQDTRTSTQKLMSHQRFTCDEL